VNISAPKKITRNVVSVTGAGCRHPLSTGV
jgi:hypothetical protein